MANYTQKAILQTFEEMLHEMSFDKITVSELVRRCEISSNTFYYHYRDIYDLFDKWIEKIKSEFLAQTADVTDWAEKFKCALHMMQDEKKLVFNLFDSTSRERLERFVFNAMSEFFYELVCRAADGADVEEDMKRSMAEFCCYLVLGYLLEFLWKRMEVDIDAEIDRIKMVCYGAIEYVVRKSVSEDLTAIFEQDK